MNLSIKEIISIKNPDSIDQILWLYPDSQEAWIEWSAKVQQFENEEKNQIQHIQKRMIESDSPITKNRLSQICEAKKKNLKIICKTLDKFKRDITQKPVISTQQVNSYFQNIFRDWAWENNQECKIYFEFVQSQLLDSKEENIFILGSGASRLSYDLAQNYPHKNIISFDHNPFLLLIAQKIFQGHEVKLHDYTYYPKSLDECSKTYKIKVGQLKTENHQFILGAFPKLPLKEESLDVIIAPWFFDILDFNFKESILHTLKFLKPNGQLLLFGPSNIHTKLIQDQLCSDEIKDFLSSLFGKSFAKLENINYLNNPLTAQNRIEQIILFAGDGPIKSKDPVNIRSSKDRIVFTPSLAQYKAFNQTYYHILKHIEQDTDLNELAKKLKQEFDFNQDEAEFYAKNFIQKINQDLTEL